jgi:gluconate 2-dehydrogenase gamma chain
MRRREFLIIPLGVMGVSLIERVARVSGKLEGQHGQLRVPLRFFTAQEARIVTAACERIFPSDARGPGATEAGVVIYIDRQLAGPYGRDKYRYTRGPFVESVPEHGYQDRKNPREVYREGIRALGEFDALPVDEQIRKLRAIEDTRFFQVLRAHTIEGMFCDPMHGGNAGLVGWQLIGFPGPRMSYRNEIDQYHGSAWRPKPASLEQISGRRGRPWEDEQA